MRSTRQRKNFFVCMAIINHELVHDTIAADTANVAIQYFENKFKIKPKETLGPFIKRKSKPVTITSNIKFDGKPRKALYQDWLVNCFTLKDPENCVFLIYLKNKDDASKQPPKGTTIVPISEVRFI